jgi:hypothetical protein
VKRRRTLIAAVCLLSFIASAFAFAQWRDGRGRGRGRGRPDLDLSDRRGVPDWEVDPQFKSDVFTFVRIQYDSWGRGWSWATDYPDSDLNFPYRLQQLTSLKVDPKPKILRLTDDELFDHPFVYLIEPGSLVFSEDEVIALRRYLSNGGFLMVDDFWGEDEWSNFYHEIKRVFPDREPEELSLDHQIFSCVYKLNVKPQVPSIHAWERGLTYERWDAGEAHYKAIHDDKGRMMAIICHNTDLGDGWEREGENEQYFRQFAEKWSYPMGINIVFYAMTH